MGTAGGSRDSLRKRHSSSGSSACAPFASRLNTVSFGGSSPAVVPACLALTRTVLWFHQLERSKAFLNASKQLAGFLNAIVDFVDQNKAHLPSIAEQDLLPFPIHITILPLP